MLDAICDMSEIITEGNELTKVHEKIFSIFEFKALPEADIDKLRYSLLCPVCRQKAYFRKASKDGKQACFGSRYHDTDCAEFNPSKRKYEEEKQVLEVEALLVESDSLQIDFNAPYSIHNTVLKDPNVTEVEADSDKINHTSRAIVNKQSEVRVNKQGLKKLLVSLLRGSSLANSNVWVYTSEKHKWRAKNLFVNVNDAQPTDNGAPRMYWGTFSHADKTLNWLNPAEERTVAIPIAKYREQLLSRFSIRESRDIEGAGFIIFAKCVQSKDKKRKFLQLWGNDVQHFYISKALD